MAILLCYRLTKGTLIIMKLRIIKITPEQMVAYLQGKAVPAKLPNDLELLDAKVDLFTRQVSLVVRSDNFEEIAENLPIPELILSNTSQSKPGNVAVIVPRVEAKPESSATIAKPVPPPVSRYASKMENEFSPEQRKLLSFTVKENCVVVKPVTFLKAEWDDINDVVRGLGGRWVKGDIISYWEIPLQ
jgi:hypothetical protein